MDDYTRFPTRPVSNAPPVFNFQQPSAEIRARYAPAFESITYSKGGKEVTERLDELLKRTSFFVVAQRLQFIPDNIFPKLTHYPCLSSLTSRRGTRMSP